MRSAIKNRSALASDGAIATKSTCPLVLAHAGAGFMPFTSLTVPPIFDECVSGHRDGQSRLSRGCALESGVETAHQVLDPPTIRLLHHFDLIGTGRDRRHRLVE